MRKFFMSLMIALAVSSTASASEVPLLLFDAETGSEFAGCLNCNRYDEAAVCNQYGEYGSRYSDVSIWNRYGQFGSRYEDSSPWNKYGKGLRVVDQNGNYYGRFTLSRSDQSRLPLIQAILKAHGNVYDLDDLRDLLCE